MESGFRTDFLHTYPGDRCSSVMKPDQLLQNTTIILLISREKNLPKLCLMKMYFTLFLQVRGILYNTNLSIVSKGGAIQSHKAVKQNGTDNITGLLNAVHS